MSALNTFMNEIAEVLDYDCDSLSLIAELRRGGPTISPGDASSKQIVSTVRVSNDGYTLPSPEYDTLGSNHIDYTIVLADGSEKVPIDRALFSFQHHVLPGNCGVCVNRWVRVLDDMHEWSDELLIHALTFRARLARSASYGVMLITTGNSFDGAERVDLFETVFKGTGRGPLTVRVLDLRKYLKDLS